MSADPAAALDAGEARGRRLPRLPPRHSAANVLAGRGGATVRSVVIAFAANVVVAAAKLAAGLLTGSSALLAEAVHSTADSINEMLLGLSLRHSRLPPDAHHPFGHGRARFLWAFIAAMFTFTVGGCVSIALAIRNLQTGGAVDHVLVGGIVLIVAAAADGGSLSQTLRLARREARARGLSTFAYLRDTNDPTMRAIAVEDGAALVGVGIAAVGLAVPALGGPDAADAIASLVIGVLLAGIAVGLARPLVDLLLGRSIAPAHLARAYAILSQAPGIDEVLALYAVHVGPDEAILTAKVHPTPGQSADELARLLDDLDRRLRDELPEIAEVFIDATAHRGPLDTGLRPAE